MTTDAETLVQIRAIIDTDDKDEWDAVDKLSQIRNILDPE